MAKSKLIPKQIEYLSDSLGSLPGIGPKSAFKLAVYLATEGGELSDVLVANLQKVKNDVSRCDFCNNLASSSDPLCSICSEDRDESSLMIVETVADLIQIEMSDEFRGYYFVTERLISPLSGVRPEDISFDKLLKIFTERKVSEIIFAYSGGVEAESTIMYIKDLIKGENISLTRLGRGIPAAGNIEYLDGQTLKGAIKSREKVS